jgi:ribosome-associated protein
MDDTARNKVLEISRLLEEHRGEDVKALYIGEMSSWTDYFVISTIRSSTHLKGLLRSLHEYFSQNQITPLTPRKSFRDDEGWVLIDCGSFVIHLLDQQHRDFYELEKLWFRNELIYSSKSS